MSVSKRFSTFLNNLKLTDAQKSDGASKRESVVRALNIHYWGSSSGTSNSRFVGSWAKKTRIRPPRDVDVLFELPASIHARFEQRSGNKQSQLLQEVKTVLANSFTRTAIKGDGPIVLVSFASYDVELIPSFQRLGGGHFVCMTSLGGWYKHEAYEAQNVAMTASNALSRNNTRDLVRMMKRWQSFCGVPLRSFHIELLAIEFIATWGNRGNSEVYYDYMCRDFFAYIMGRQNGYVYAPGTAETMSLGSMWSSKAQSALNRAQKACAHEANAEIGLAGEQWQMIFGTDIPRFV
ncbi:hypothetical protein GCM10022281_18010 [Sphingomonas rosea]|uniref:Nucleotidyltransferase n=1 Tax=Sphingomonas rosea TaxID=335605 RepID=A0ABP7U8E0_9SPHN